MIATITSDGPILGMQKPKGEKTTQRSLTQYVGGSTPAFRVLIVQANPKLGPFLKFALEPLFQVEYVQNMLFGVEFLCQNEAPDLIIFTEQAEYNNLFCNYIMSHNAFANTSLISLYEEVPKVPVLEGPFHSLIYPFGSSCLYKLLEKIFDFQISLPKDYLETTDQLLSRSYPSYEQSHDEQWIKQFYHSIDPLLNQFGLNLQAVADEMCISLPHLHRKVKDITSKTPMALIKERRLQKALSALEENPHTTVKYVAYSVGYKSVKNFSKNFKSRFDKKPSDYLKK